MIGKAIVTGGAGFIGSHVVDSLLADGAAVTVVDDLSSGLVERIPQDVRFERLSIVDAEAIEAVASEVRPDAIFHLAAQASVVVSTNDPAYDCSVNVVGTLNILEAARRHGVPIVFTSTGGALYGNAAPIPTPETSIPAPVSPYGASKWAAEAYINTWAGAHDVPHAICRLGNVYGPRQSPHGEAGVVAIFSEHIYSGRTPRMYGHGDPTRDYIHVEDVVSALRAALGHRGTFNIATGKETSVRSLWDTLAREAGSALEPELAPLRPGELERSCMDTRYTAAEIGFSAQITVEAGLLSTYHALVAELADAGQKEA